MMVAEAIVPIVGFLKPTLELAHGPREGGVKLTALLFALQLKPLRPDADIHAAVGVLAGESDMGVPNGGKLASKPPR